LASPLAFSLDGISIVVLLILTFAKCKLSPAVHTCRAAWSHAGAHAF
jgi:hypothetical protein